MGSSDNHDKKYFQKNINNLDTLINYIKSNGWEPILISIPVVDSLCQLRHYIMKGTSMRIKQSKANDIIYFDFNDFVY